MASEARQEIEHQGLSWTLTAYYVTEQHVVRLGRPGPGGIPERGIDYPVHADYLQTLMQHVQVLARTRLLLAGLLVS